MKANEKSLSEDSPIATRPLLGSRTRHRSGIAGGPGAPVPDARRSPRLMLPTVQSGAAARPGPVESTFSPSSGKFNSQSRPQNPSASTQQIFRSKPQAFVDFDSSQSQNGLDIDIDLGNLTAQSQLYKAMPRPGRSIPQLRPQDFGATVHYDHDAVGRAIQNQKQKVLQGKLHKGLNMGKKVGVVPPPLPTAGPVGSKTTKKPKKDMLARFDEAVANPNSRIAARTTLMKKQVQREIDQRVKANPSTNTFQREMDNMKSQFLDEVTAELGFNFDPRKNSFKDLDYPVPDYPKSSGKMNPVDAMHKKIDSMTKNWAADAQKVANKNWIPSLDSRYRGSDHPLEKTKTPSQNTRVRNNQSQNIKPVSESVTDSHSPQQSNPPHSSSSMRAQISKGRLSKISNGFRKSLEPFANQDLRKLIKTPNEDMMKELEEMHSHSLNHNIMHDPHQGLYPRPRQPFEMADFDRESMLSASGSANSMGSGPAFTQHDEMKNLQQMAGMNLGQQQKKLSMNSISRKPSLGGDVSRRPSNASSKGHDMSGLMDFRSLLKIQSEKPSKLEPPYRGRGPAPLEMSTVQTPSISQLIREIPALAPIDISNQAIHGHLKESLKSMDQAAKVAQTLGSLMSRVAIQNSSAHTNANQEEVQKHAIHLREVAETARKSVEQHSVSCGIDVNVNMGMKTDESGSEGGNDRRTSTGTDSEIQTQTDDIANGQWNEVFEFVSDMSFTDQLMLKKLRDLQPTWINGGDGENQM